MWPINYLYKKLYYHKYKTFIGSDGYRFGKVPTVLFIEPTNACDLNCIMCPRNNMKRLVGQLPIELYKDIIDQGFGKGLTNVYFQGFGEPLINKRITDFIRYAKEKNLHTGMTTNASFLTNEMSKDLINSGLDEIHFSIDGFRESTYKKIRGRDNLLEVRKNVLGFIELMQGKIKPVVEVQIIIMPETEEDIGDFKEYWREKLKGIPHSSQFVKEYNNWGDKVKRKTILPDFIFKNHVQVSCRRLSYAMAINHDGIAVACCNDFDNNLLIGDLKSQTLEQVWNGKPMMMLRDAHIKKNLENHPICLNCDSSRKYPILTLYFNIRKILNR